MPVSRLGARILGNDRPGPLSSSLRHAYWEKRRRGWRATPIDYGQPDDAVGDGQPIRS